jgi:hypothetical protein
MPMMYQNYGGQYMPYGPDYYGGWGQGYYSQVPQQMMGRSGGGWGMDYEEGYDGNGWCRGSRMPMFQNQFERETYLKMIRSSERGVMPCQIPDDS